MKILILDDNKQLCDILTEILTNEGLVVDVVLSFEDALKKINYKYDVVLADYFLDFFFSSFGSSSNTLNVASI